MECFALRTGLAATLICCFGLPSFGTRSAGILCSCSSECVYVDFNTCAEKKVLGLGVAWQWFVH